MASNKLTNTKIKGKLSTGKYTDGEGLYLQVLKSGVKSFRRNYRFNGMQNTYTFGTYPTISLSKARELNREVGRLLAEGQDPNLVKKNQQKNKVKPFSHYAYKWLDKQRAEGRAENTLHDYKLRIEKNLIPELDKRPVETFTTADLLKILQVVSNRGARESALRLASVLRRIFNELLILGVVENNPAQGLNELLVKPIAQNKGNFHHITDPIAFGRLLREIDNPPPRRDFAVTQALRIMPFLFLRPVNVRFMKWMYIDFENQLLTIPATEMKTKKELKVPLAKQAIQILKEIQPLTGDETYVFVSGHSKNGQPISENTTTLQLRNKIIDPVTNQPFKVTSHGFRHTASTLLNELGYDPDVIELQLGHLSKDRIRATYNKAELMDRRITMMQEWADYIDGLKQGNVIPFQQKRVS